MAAQRITAPIATPERAAALLGVPKKRTQRLVRWADQSRVAVVTRAKVTGSDGKIVTRKAAVK